MKFEDYLKNNKDKLQHDVNKEAIWDKISTQTPSEKSNSLNKYVIIGVLVLVSILFWTLYKGQQYKAKQIEDNSNELMALKDEIYNLVKKEQTSSRIRAVNMSHEANYIDQEIIVTLIDRMKNDQSPNVQLAAIRALEQHINFESVRVAMIETISMTKDPYLQIKLIDILSINKEQRLIPYLDSIIIDDNKQSIVLEKAERGRKMLKEI